MTFLKPSRSAGLRGDYLCFCDCIHDPWTSPNAWEVMGRMDGHKRTQRLVS